MNFHQPSKRIQILLAIVIVLAVGLLGYRLFGDKLFAKTQSANLIMVSPELSAQSDVDTDGDGLKDWQEALWGSDPKNPDTDEDGTKDGEEVAAGRDPIVAGPNDALSVTRPNTATTTASVADPSDPYGAKGNSTDKLARELFSSFMANGGLEETDSIASGTQQQIVNQAVSDIKFDKSSPTYTLGDIHLSNSNSKESIQAYADDLSKALKNSLIKYASVDPNTSKLSDVMGAFDDGAKALATISVPGDIATVHLNLVNDFSQMYQEYKILNTNSETDPIKALIAIRALQSIETDQKQLFTSIASYFENNDILFDKNGPGFSLINATSS